MHGAGTTFLDSLRNCIENSHCITVIPIVQNITHDKCSWGCNNGIGGRVEHVTGVEKSGEIESVIESGC
jgi:hypothetical protein